ncbi:protein of unknown function [Hyphomicrobium sp. MC1]|nr:protein of unknown function [Hyphomicrobium sp. MC1]
MQDATGGAVSKHRSGEKVGLNSLLPHCQPVMGVVAATGPESKRSTDLWVPRDVAALVLPA